MTEAAVVVGPEGSALHWHLPPGRSAVSLPDAPDLWEVLWRHRAALVGVAHTHPGRGRPDPSHEDLTTFAAIESALGARLTWWIASEDRLIELGWSGPDRLAYAARDVADAPPWLPGLRDRSYDPR